MLRALPPMTVVPLIAAVTSVIRAGAGVVNTGVGDSIGSPKPPIRPQSWKACQCTASSGSTQQNTGKPDRARISSRAERRVVLVHRRRDSPVTGSVMTLVGIQLWTYVVVSSAARSG